MDNDISTALQDHVRQALKRRTTLAIVGGNSKEFYGRASQGEPLLVGAHQGIVGYQPKELVITVRAGTPLHVVERVLAERSQMLAFEPPYFGNGATVGGMVACGLSGPRRPYAGSVRDFVLGVRLINGTGEIGKFGGEVMKNVAGYDVSRLITGALGTLGVILEVSLKVLPRTAATHTLVFEVEMAPALEKMNQWARQPLPISAACYLDNKVFVRLEGSHRGVDSARTVLGGEEVSDAGELWRALREHQHEFFITREPLYRISLPPATPPLTLPGRWLIEWGGAQRWLITDVPIEEIRAVASRVEGHVTVFRNGARDGEVFTPLTSTLARLHRNIKQAFDPSGIFNVGRMYPNW